MATNLPRISIVVNDEEGGEAQGSTSLLSVGFGIHQTWMYATAFSTIAIVPNSPFEQFVMSIQALVPVTLLSSMAVLALVLIMAGLRDKHVSKFFNKDFVALASVALCVIGVLGIFLAHYTGVASVPCYVLAGICVGFGGAGLMLFWGLAFARTSVISIVINTALAMGFAILLYAGLVYLIPPEVAKWVITVLPLCEVPFIVQQLKIRSSREREIPLFDPLPVKLGTYSTRLMFGMLLFGFALGSMRTISAISILGSQGEMLQLVIYLVACIPALLFLLTLLKSANADRWDRLLHRLIPFVVIMALLSSCLITVSKAAALFMLFVSYVSFEASLWVFFVGMAQDFRVSPVFMIGIGRGSLTLGTLAGIVITRQPWISDMLPFGTGVSSSAVLMVIFLMAGYLLLPRVSTIRKDTPVAANAQTTEGVLETLDVLDSLEEFAEENAKGSAAGFNPNAQSSAGLSNATPFSQLATGQPNPLDPPSIDAFKAACENIANRYLLSQRQTEVLYMLARGHNAAYIQDKLCVTVSTAKSHIYNIYKKLDIHTQHELLAIVEEEIERL